MNDEMNDLLIDWLIMIEFINKLDSKLEISVTRTNRDRII